MFRDAVFAEVVSTWECDGIPEHVQTDAAQKLLFSQKIAGSRHVDDLLSRSGWQTVGV